MTDDVGALPRHVAAFHACAACSYDFATGEGERSCSYYECPYLPVELDVRCPTCLYNFLSGEGVAECGERPDCDFARDEAPARLTAFERWRALQA